jgi:hypothetical protein
LTPTRSREDDHAMFAGLGQGFDAGQALAAHYEALNPTWRDGVSLPILFSVDGLLERRTLARVWRR